jgi:hypothetical protein
MTIADEVDSQFAQVMDSYLSVVRKPVAVWLLASIASRIHGRLVPANRAPTDRVT